MRAARTLRGQKKTGSFFASLSPPKKVSFMRGKNASQLKSSAIYALRRRSRERMKEAVRQIASDHDKKEKILKRDATLFFFAPQVLYICVLWRADDKSIEPVSLFDRLHFSFRVLKGIYHQMCFAIAPFDTNCFISLSFLQAFHFHFATYAFVTTLATTMHK